MKLHPIIRSIIPLPMVALMMLCSCFSFAQSGKKITGKVTDENSIALAGVSISVKGASGGTTTDESGSYSINISDQNAVLIFTYSGYLKQEVSVNNRNVVDIKLAPDSKSQTLNQVVVVGYGTQRKVDLTGSVSSITKKDFVDKPFTSPDQILAGRATGVNIANRSGDPGAPIEVRIRGVGTIGNNQPLWVIDGVPTVQTTNISVNTSSATESNPLASINPSDIESMDILKDASASAIYGARAANGVIIVTTKKGKEGRTSLTYDGYTGFSYIPKSKLIDVLNVDQFIKLQQDAGNPNAANFATYSGKPFVNWQKAMISTKPLNSQNVSISGGTKNFTFNIAGGYLSQEGNERAQNFKRVSLRANSELKVGKYLKFGESVLLSSTNRLVQSEEGLYAAFSSARNVPFYAIYDKNDPTGYNPSNNVTHGDGGAGTNYVFTTDLKYVETRVITRTALATAYGELEPIAGLKYRLQVGAEYHVGDGFYFQEQTNDDYGSGQHNSLLVQERPIELTTTVTNTLTYTKSFGKHNLTLLVGEEETNFSYSKFRIQGDNLVNSSVRLASVAASSSSANQADQWALRGFLGRVFYSYDDKYLFTFNTRRDQSSRFSESNRSGIFPSFSVGWKISNENFMKNSTFINDLKIRGSWGQSGNQFTGENFSYLPTLATTIYYPIGNTQKPIRGLAPITFANGNLKWETNSQTDVGFDATLLNNKIDITFDYYNKRSKNVLLSKPLPYSSGYFLPADANLGSIRNSGIELAITYRNSIGKLQYSVTGNVTTVKNEVLSLGGIPEIITGIGGAQTHRTTVGEPLGYFYGYKTNGLYQNADEIAKDPAASPDAAPGDIRFVDVNKDGKIDANDQVKLGSNIPKYYYGIDLSLRYGGFDGEIFFQGVGGNQIYNQGRSGLESMNGGSNQSTRVLGRWTGEGTSNSMPRATYNDLNNNNRYSDRWIESGSFLRIKNIQIGYTVPRSALQSVTHDILSRSRFYIGVQNLKTFTKYLGYDPEVTRSQSFQKGEFPLANGIDGGGSPQPTIVQFGWQITLN
ncbi:MAG: TonB-dependent receptor [Bacteroidetes bacterium]|nr:TonB-dependent receptor [Bacteroidota bacterium]